MSDPVGEADYAELVRDMGAEMAAMLAAIQAFAKALGRQSPVEVQQSEGAEEVR